MKIKKKRFTKKIKFLIMLVLTVVLTVPLFSNVTKALSTPQQPARYINVGIESNVMSTAYGEVYSSFRFLENNFRSGGYYGVVLNVESPDSSSPLELSAIQTSPSNDFNYIFDDKENTLVMYESFIYSGDYSLGSYNMDTPKTYVDFENNNYVYAVFDFINNFTFRVKAYYSNGTFDYLKTYDINFNRNFWFTTLSRGYDSNDYWSGYWTGYNESYDKGFNDGKQEGLMEGQQEAFNDGYIDGRNDYGILYQNNWLNASQYGDIRYQVGIQSSQGEAYDKGFLDGSNESFSSNLHIWLVPAIIVVLFGGGFLYFASRRRE